MTEEFHALSHKRPQHSLPRGSPAMFWGFPGPCFRKATSEKSYMSPPPENHLDRKRETPRNTHLTEDLAFPRATPGQQQKARMWKSSSDSKTRVLPKSARAVGRRQQVTGRSTEQLLTRGRGWGRGQALQLKLSLRSLDRFQASEGFKEKLFKLLTSLVASRENVLPQDSFPRSLVASRPDLSPGSAPTHREALGQAAHGGHELLCSLLPACQAGAPEQRVVRRNSGGVVQGLLKYSQEEQAGKGFYSQHLHAEEPPRCSSQRQGKLLAFLLQGGYGATTLSTTYPRGC